jgi:hypothetical protein
MDEGRRKAGKYHAKFDYEPLDLLTINLGIYDPQQALAIVDLVDQLGFDSISLGATLGYVMDYNRQHPAQPILNGLSFGDFEATCDLVRQTAAGQCPEVGRGVKRLAESLGEPAYAMHCKGVELPAYLPETNPGYPFALAGGHMSMRTFLLLVFEGETSMDYWVDAIVNRGIYYTRDDLLGLCKFAGTPDSVLLPSFKELYGVDITVDDMMHATQRTYLRGLLLEQVRTAMSDVQDFRRKHGDAFYFNWRLVIPREFQLPFVATHSSMAELRVDESLPAHELAAILRRVFSGIVSGNVRDDTVEQIEKHGPFIIHGSARVMALLDNLLAAFVAQRRMKISGREYQPCYRVS